MNGKLVWETVRCPNSARSSAWIEQWGPNPKVVGSNPIGRAGFEQQKGSNTSTAKLKFPKSEGFLGPIGRATSNL